MRRAPSRRRPSWPTAASRPTCVPARRRPGPRASPRSGRATVGGRLLGGGRPLEAADAGSSLPTSHVPTLLRHQVRSPLSWVPLEEVRGDPAALRRALRDRVEAGIRVLVADSASDEDIVRVAAAARGAGG